MKPGTASSRAITPVKALTPLASGTTLKTNPKPGTPGTNLASLAAFNTGALFPRTGDAVLQDFRDLMTSAIESMRGEIAGVMVAQEQRLESKLDVMMRAVANMSNVIGEGALHRERAAFANQSADQHLKVSEQLSQVLQHLDDVHKKSDLDEFALRLLERMDLPCIFDMKMSSLTHRFREFQLDGKSQTEKVVQTLDEIASKTVDSITNVTGNSIGEMRDGLQKCQDVTSEEFHILLSEIARIQQGLGLDYSKAASIPRKKKTSSQKSGNEHTVKRHRDFGLQTEANKMENWCQTDADLMKGKVKKPLPKQAAAPDTQKLAVQEAESMKAKARKALSQPQYNVMDYYHTDGFCQAVARDPKFENVTLVLISINAIWIAIDTDLNNAATISTADVGFQVMDHLFCTYFFFEVLIRFCAFVVKRHAFKDAWFVFDFLLVFNMVVDTWILPIVMLAVGSDSGGSFAGNLTVLRVLRLVKLLRLSRMTKILRNIPELVIIMKALAHASRSVAIFSCMWMLIIYFFAIVMRQLTDGTEAGATWFKNVPDAMATLLLNGILPDHASLVKDLGSPDRGSPIFSIVMTSFVLLASITVMYMLVGVLVEVVSKIAAQEKENLTVSYIASLAREKIESSGRDCDAPFTKTELQRFLFEPDFCKMLTHVNVDIVALMDMLEIAYEDVERSGQGMTFDRLIELLLNSRGTNAATVRDTKEVLRIVKQAVNKARDDLRKSLSDEFNVVHSSLALIRDEVLESGGNMYDDMETGSNATGRQ